MVANTMTLTGWAESPDQETEEVAILRRIAQRDEAAFETLYNRYHPTLFRFVQRMVNDPSQVEEVVSDTLYAVWKGADKFQRKSKVSTWIYGIGYRTALKALRSGKRHNRFTLSDDSVDVAVDLSSGNDPAECAEMADAVSHVTEALKKLSPEQKAVVELTALGWSCVEIGEIVGCPSNTVKTRMFSARKKLCSALGPTPF